MSTFLHIMGNNIIPIFVIIGLGYILSRKFDFSLLTLNKLIFYLFVPSFIFYNLYTTNLSLDMLNVLLFCVINLIFNHLLATVISKIRKYDIGLTNAYRNAIMFNNSGNIGLSLITLVFSSAPFIINGSTPYLNEALAAQIIVMVFMNITMNTLGIYNAGRAKMNIKDSMRKIFSMPAVYAVPLALLLKYLHIDITPIPFWPAIVFIKGGLVPMALLTLGAQLSITKFSFRNFDVNLAALTRVAIGPILALILILIFGFTGVIAQTLIISYALPTAVNTALIAVECNNNPRFASQEVMVSTILSAATLTLAIYLARVLFPI